MVEVDTRLGAGPQVRHQARQARPQVTLVDGVVVEDALEAVEPLEDTNMPEQLNTEELAEFIKEKMNGIITTEEQYKTVLKKFLDANVIMAVLQLLQDDKVQIIGVTDEGEPILQAAVDSKPIALSPDRFKINFN